MSIPSFKSTLSHIVHAFGHATGYQSRLTLFFAKLSALSEQWYQAAYALLKRDK